MKGLRSTMPPEPTPKNLRLHESTRQAAKPFNPAERTLSDVKNLINVSLDDEEYASNMDFDEFIAWQSSRSPKPAENKERRSIQGDSQKLYSIYKAALVPEVNSRFAGLVNFDPKEEISFQQSKPKSFGGETVRVSQSASLASTSESNAQDMSSQVGNELSQLEPNPQFALQPLMATEQPGLTRDMDLYRNNQRSQIHVIASSSADSQGHEINIVSRWQSIPTLVDEASVPNYERSASGRETAAAFESPRSETTQVLAERYSPLQLDSMGKHGRGYLTNGDAFNLASRRVKSYRRRLTDWTTQQAREYDDASFEPQNKGLQSGYGTQQGLSSGSRNNQQPRYGEYQGQSVQPPYTQPTSTSNTYQQQGSDMERTHASPYQVANDEQQPSAKSSNYQQAAYQSYGQTGQTLQSGYMGQELSTSNPYPYPTQNQGSDFGPSMTDINQLQPSHAPYGQPDLVHQAGYDGKYSSSSISFEQPAPHEPYSKPDEGHLMYNGGQYASTSGSYHELPSQQREQSGKGIQPDDRAPLTMSNSLQQLPAQQSGAQQYSNVPGQPLDRSQQLLPQQIVPHERNQQPGMMREQDGSNFFDADEKKHSKKVQTPSHVLICRVVLGQDGGQFMEEHKLCLDEFAPSPPLAEIFLSTFLAHHARANGYRVEYDHNCGRHRIDQVQIQELLASPLVVPDSADSDMTKQHIQGICKMIVDDEQRRHQSNAIEILLWDTSSPTSGRALTEAERSLKNPSQVGPVSMLERLVPTIFANMYDASMKSRLVKTALKAGYGVLKGRDASSEHLALGRAAVYLPCRDYECEDLALVPYTSYMLHLPMSVHIVDVIVSPRCLERLPGCRRYVNDLASTIRQFSPEMSVEVIAAEPSNPDTIARLVEAEHVLCGPGFGMVCLFPSLARDSGRMTLFDVGPEQIEGYAASSYVSRLPQNLIKHITPPASPFSVAFLSDFGGQDEVMRTFAQLPPNKDAGDCRFFRGRVGKWNQDMAYAEHAQYRTPLAHYSGNAEKLFRRKVEKGEYGDLKYRPSTTYRFDEARYQTCAAVQTTQDSVCAMLKSLGARRIFILGDSLNLQMAQSMWMWLTNANHGESPTVKGSLDPNFKTTLQCMGYGSYTLQFVRNDELLENDEPVSIDESKKNCQTYCYPWAKAYQEDASRTIMIFNVGAHLHEFERYTAAIDRFVDVFDGMNRLNDLVLFRTLVPGHWNCSRPGLTPFQNFAAYKKDAEEHPNLKEQIYTWGKFSSYNDYAIRKLDNRRFESTSTGTTKALMEVVDVFPMTVLRPDGHCSDEFRPPSYLDSDCLHYNLPGPVDWWSHLAFSHLNDIATAENYLAQQAA